MFAFDRWANLAVVDAVAPVADRAPKALGWIAHVAGAKRLWFARLLGVPSPLAVWPTLTVDECRVQLSAAHDEWMAHLATLTDDDLQGFIRYTNTRGETFSSALADIVTHVPLHGHHHRGQAAAAIRDAGGAPPVIDFIHASRQKYV